ncbi:sugar permease [Enterococcus sp. JM4C]|uniref:carbohydrate ABC transporter permease n=1 Tax=Candidatus Enterococcus huntleyi TaxID=1857217 RepID=UPI001379FD96|nr:carbohydrate ABC transporter permease [Enterococcus sp. JM4C]KAF1296211.1 sugar permease [Enterococcus sp. JM4C]
MSKYNIRLAFLCVVALVVCYPFIFLTIGSFMGSDELRNNLGGVLDKGTNYVTWSWLPMYPTLSSYVKVLLDTPAFFMMFWNSVKISLGVLAGQFMIATPCAWGFAQGKFKGKRGLFFIYIVLMLMPFQVLMLPEYLMLKNLNLIDTLGAVILPNIFSTFPVFIMVYFFKAVPRITLEAARIDGASEWRIFFQIGIPLGKSGIISALLLTFFENWNLIEQPMLFLEDKQKWPLSLQLPNISLEKADVAIVSSMVAMILPILLFLTFQKELEEGIAVSASKE